MTADGMKASAFRPVSASSRRGMRQRLPQWAASASPLMMTMLGVGAALLERGPATAALAAALALLGAAGVWAGWRRGRMMAEMDRLAAEHRMLRESIEHNPMPYAVYDDQDYLIAWNKAYEATHAEGFERLRRSAEEGRLRYDELIRVTVEGTLPPEAIEAHIAERRRSQREADGAAVDRQYPRLGWLRICKFATPSGAVAGFAVDINELKEREAALERQIALSDALARQLRELADTDVLTGVQSRRAFFERAAEEVQRARRNGRPLCLAMLDIDAFKAVNDIRGHAAGDRVLAGVAAACRSRLRAGVDQCGRIGGEEFAILIPETDLTAAQTVAERICTAIRELEFEAAGHSFGVSASIGVAALSPRDDAVAALMARADAALYGAKGAGRDRVLIVDADGDCSAQH